MSYPRTPGHKTGGTSRDAAEEMRDRARSLRRSVLRELKVGGPGTADEIAQELKESVLSIRPRMSELYADGKIVKTKKRRKNISGKYAHVWKVPG